MTGSRRVDAARTQRDTSSARATRRRPSWSDRQAAVAQLRRLTAEGRPLGAHVKAVAAKWGVSPRAVYTWLKDSRLADGSPKPERKRFEPTVEHLTVVAQEQDMQSAHGLLEEAGLVTCSYETFARAMRERTNPTLLAAALDGYPGLVNNRAYLSWTAPHRNHTWHLDHTIMDLWVWPSHKHRSPIKPQVTVVVDGYSSLLHAVPWKTPVNGDMVGAALVEFGTERDYLGVTVGGQPEQVVCDNAAQHFGPSMREGVERLGWILAPTAAYSSWQNGIAERALGLLNKRLANRAPGATKAGKIRTGASRHAARLPKDIKPEDVLGWSVFCDLLQDTVNEINTTIRMKKHGRTRLDAFAADPTELRHLDLVEYRTSLMTSGDLTYMWTKNGLNFDGNSYFGTGLKYGHRYRIRYLPTNRDFIEVFDLDNEWICQATRADLMTREQVAPFLAERAETEREFQAIEKGVIHFRRQIAAGSQAGVTYGDEDTSYDGSEDRAAVVNRHDSQSTEAEPDTPADTTDSNDSSEPKKTQAGSPRKGTGRPPAPRVPATPPPAEDDAARQATARLAAKYGSALQPQEPTEPGTRRSTDASACPVDSSRASEAPTHDEEEHQ
ncbi:DDE-type integrase/transposase/recombinase [Modestobacter caceresii]|uniref:DDE-type integrase/transposase/recombinase n=1 Tax=Modestobacter caceresii TaxID=1522368 RepID=UPI0009DCB6A2|nr:DDE-type integrase/transposase/recombinase [Modestobacter caceresii]